jgi:hypothetical protein
VLRVLLCLCSHPPVILLCHADHHPRHSSLLQVDAVLGDVIGRNTIKKGRAIMIGDKEVEYNPKFRLILHTKMGNPHYKPEMQAQCTLINFTVTQAGLEDQLLADVVGSERADLQELKAKLTKEQNQFMITLKGLEDNLLARLSSAEGNFLEDEALVVGLEETKKTAEEISKKVELAAVTEIDINKARERYRPAAARGSLLYVVDCTQHTHARALLFIASFGASISFVGHTHTRAHTHNTHTHPHSHTPTLPPFDPPPPPPTTTTHTPHTGTLS